MKTLALLLTLFCFQNASAQEVCVRFYIGVLDRYKFPDTYIAHCLTEDTLLNPRYLAVILKSTEVRSEVALNLGLEYSLRLFSPEAPFISAYWYEHAASLGNPVAQYRMFLLHQARFGVELDPERGLVWLRQSVAQSHPDALFALAGCYEVGVGVEQSTALARYYYARANAQGHLGAASAYAYLSGR